MYEVKGGGFLRTEDSRSHVVSSAVPYPKQMIKKEICYRYDDAKPEHCLHTKTCTKQPLVLESRITRSSSFHISFSGWTDPVPNGGKQTHASGIQSFEVKVLEVPPSKNNLVVDVTTKPVYLRLVDKTIDSMVIQVNVSDQPVLYCILLEVKDVADNVQQARRFLLYDNTTFIEPMPGKHFRVTSASKDTSFTWQTHHNDVCLDWKDYFYNKFYFDNELLNPIKSDRHGLITGVYDQIDGILPTAGTPNVNGIVEYRFSWALDDNDLSTETRVPNFRNQTYCQHFVLKDGETYKLNIKAIDIANNSYEESRTVHIDRSVPYIENMWLRKGDYKTLFVHNDKDMSKMNLYFEAFDQHSGIRNIDWFFGITDAGSELAQGSVTVGRINKVEP